MATDLSHLTEQPNLSNSCVNLREDLDALSAVELAEALERALDAMTDETYDETLIIAYLDALDRKAPMPEMPDAATAYADFQRAVGVFRTDIEPQAVSAPAKRPGRVRRLLRTGLVAAAAALCVLGGMITAQAIGINVFGAMARWTEEIFSFGPTHEVDISSATHDPAQEGRPVIAGQGQEYLSLQEALDAYGITEVTAPTWLPDGYVLSELSVADFEAAGILAFFATYENDGMLVDVDVMRRVDGASTQVEKTDAPVEIFKLGGITFYLIENTNNYTVAWMTEHYECYISTPRKSGKDVSREIVSSMFN